MQKGTSYFYLLFSWVVMILFMSTSMSKAEENQELETAIFAGGCFWCMEPPFEKLDGVKEVISGYTAGSTKNPTYQQVSSGITGHTEAIKITFDPSKVTYEKLLAIFWKNIDPLTLNAQFCDHG